MHNDRQYAIYWLSYSHHKLIWVQIVSAVVKRSSKLLSSAATSGNGSQRLNWNVALMLFPFLIRPQIKLTTTHKNDQLLIQLIFIEFEKCVSRTMDFDSGKDAFTVWLKLRISVANEFVILKYSRNEWFSSFRWSNRRWINKTNQLISLNISFKMTGEWRWFLEPHANDSNWV